MLPAAVSRRNPANPQVKVPFSMPRLPRHAELLAKLAPLHARLAQDAAAANRPIYQTTPEQVGVRLVLVGTAE